ncbi:MAG: signal peptidase [Clostridia bacterium]|nr:signal peptidase [Clostridia bacterium]
MSTLDKHTVTIKAIIEFLKEPFLAVLAALMISSFIISHTKIPTGSMMFTINPGDHLIVNRLPYYYRDPERGEIAVFRFEEENLIKRVIGKPNDIINIIDNNIYVNNQKLDEGAYLKTLDSTYEFSGSTIDFPYKVPEGYYFMMGDNRKNSKDSRYFGPIPRETIFAKGGFRIYPFSRIGSVK